MRMYLIVLLCVLSCKNQGQTGPCDSNFFEAVTKADNSFIVFNANVDSRNEKVCLSNRSLKWRLKDKFGVDGKAYSELV